MTTKRYNELQTILKSRKYFKVVCGAGNEDSEEVRALSMVYTLAGAVGIDVSANVDIVVAAMDGIERAYAISKDVGIRIEHRPFVNISVGLKGDPHVRKAKIDADLCSECGMCLEACEQKAIADITTMTVVSARCIGCGACEKVCPENAISYYAKKVELDQIIPACLRAGAETLELHAVVADEVAVMRDWHTLAGLLPDNYISMCLDRSQLSDAALINRISKARDVVGERLIIQADGAPMSGGQDDYRTTLQAVAIADVIQKSGIPLMLLLSGGTNSKTGELARLCNIDFNGIAIGTFARKLVRAEIESADFYANVVSLRCAVSIARRLVDDNIKQGRE
jgi:Fe-S-cluster-containing hydrogenase component 2